MNANAIRFRSGTLDSLRGLTLFSMIAYHLCWDLVYLRGLPWAWYNGFWAYIWQQSICCTFILKPGGYVIRGKALWYLSEILRQRR